MVCSLIKQSIAMEICYLEEKWEVLNLNCNERVIRCRNPVGFNPVVSSVVLP